MVSFTLSDKMRRLIDEARQRQQGTGGSAADPFADIPSQSAPHQVAYWEPGRLYQPGDLVQANNLGAVAQAALTNYNFESGDSDWTKETDWAINTNDAFDGSYAAEYAGATGALLLIPYTTATLSGVYETADGSTFDNDALSGAYTTIVAASDTLAIAMTINVSNTFQKVSYSTDGTTWNTAATPPSGVTPTCFYNDDTGLFYISKVGTLYTSSDGDTWTGNSAPSGVGVFLGIWKSGSTYYGVLTSGRVYSSSDGYSGWTIVNTNIGLTPSQVLYDGTNWIAVSSSTGNVNMYATTDITIATGTTWTHKSTGETALEGILNSSSLNNGIRLAYYGGTYVAQTEGADSTGSQTDKTATSTDLDAWTARTSYGGGGLMYSTTLGKFVSAGIDSGNGYLHTSTDGATWSQTLIAASLTAAGRNQPPGDFALTAPTRLITNDDRATTFAGQIVTAKCKVKTGADTALKLGIAWYDSGSSLIQIGYGDALSGASSNWREIDVVAVAPQDAATCTAVVAATGGDTVYADYVQWDHYTLAGPSYLIFEATQAAAGYSGQSEPTWPTVVGNTVVDNEVTWTARAANAVVWEAKPILLSGSSEPTWPTEEGATVVDNTILWTADSGRVKDANCPNTKQVAIAASKVFCGDDDIIAYCATVNPLDWSSVDDAGFIPFGLNTYGSEPVTALGIYRSNLVAWNNKGFQMWQVDEDPQNFALLDAIPVGNRFYKSAAPVSNDLVWLTDEGVRNMGIAGASTNLQAGYFGKQIDTLIRAAIDAIGDEDDIIALYYPGQGQYWIIFEDEAFVLTMNGGKQDMSWSRYTFPSNIDDYTIKDGELYLRSGDKVWLFDRDAVQDDVGGTPSDFEGRVWWHYLDFGALGITKSLIGFDIVATGTFNVALGYDESNTATATTDYELTGDTLPNGVIPLPVTAPSLQLRLTWAGGEAWEWYASALYLQDWRITS